MAKKKFSKKPNPKKTTSAKKPNGVRGKIEAGATLLSMKIRQLFGSTPADVTDAVKMDHDSLRNYLKILRDTDREMAERRRAYKAFSALLKSHTVAEEEAVYGAALELTGRELHLKIAEGYVEHHLSDDLMARLDRIRDAMEWSAHANVLAEIVEHHLKEEESDLLPLVKKTASPEKNQAMLEFFIALRGKTQKRRSTKNVGVLASV